MPKIAFAVLATALSLTAPAWAGPVPIPTLFNTGVDASGNPLSDSTVGDPHYTLLQVPGASSSNTVVFQGVGADGKYPIGPWAGNDNRSAWVAPDNGDARNDNPIGEYYYQTTFDLTGFDPGTAIIYGAWAADDVGAQMWLNGVPLDVLTDLQYGSQNYDHLNSFHYYYRDSQGQVQEVVNAPLQTGFLPGINTLTFRVDNLGGSTGLRTELIGTADPVPAPEPASFALLLTPIAAVLLLRRSR